MVAVVALWFVDLKYIVSYFDICAPLVDADELRNETPMVRNGYSEVLRAYALGAPKVRVHSAALN